MMALWQRGLDLVAQIATAVASVMIVTLIVIFGWLVYGRYILNATPTWVEQAALLMVVWITFLGAAVGVRRGTHLSVDFIRRHGCNFRDLHPMPSQHGHFQDKL